jgi:hypothetical protein
MMEQAITRIVTEYQQSTTETTTTDMDKKIDEVSVPTAM